MKQRLDHFASAGSSITSSASVVGLEKGKALNRSLHVEMLTKV